MKDKLSALITIIISLLIIAIIGFFGYIVWDTVKELDVSAEPEKFKTEISSENIVDKETIKTPNVVETENPFDNIKSESNENKNIDYSNVTVDKYFYNQLEEPSKIIYKAFESNKENMKTGTFQIELGNSFDNILNSTTGGDKLAQYYQSAIEAYTYDNPDVFYLSPNKIYLNIETTQMSNGNTYNVYINNGKASNYLIDEFANEIQVNDALNQINAVKNDLISKRTGNTYEDIKMVHDYLVDTVTYDTSISKPNIYNMYGALIAKEAVCEGYARAFKYIMDEMGIPCTLVIGQGRNSKGEIENHAWNYVQVGDSWYALDTTWDDPVIVGGGYVSKSSKYKYFLKGINTFNNDHTPSGQFTPNGKVFLYPNLSTQDY